MPFDRSDFPVGDNFAELSLEGYTNINKLYPQKDRLHGVETLCGDWTGTTLVLGQDFAHTDLIEERRTASPNENPFYHDKKNLTNRNLCEFLRPRHTVSIDGSTKRTAASSMQT